MVNIFKNIFTSNNKQQAVETTPAQKEDTLAQATSENTPTTDKKPKHGEDGVCCGGCS
ncbi:CCGSCS motif protein [Marinicella gelatinilytica]|uniref:CCGSCS motif protein n=1 Tax=Marinicella gelatinilytica TaxID=2996017 RepID=UPI002260991C|nr:CCGSCS motif protein [Marinicella gelatinilytica]MCX7545986.1 CCGSCS motif protein [Marinicella gelatinilytica]